MEDQNLNTIPKSIPMEKAPRARATSSCSARNILRRSIYIFLQNYIYFTSNIAFVALPFSASILISQSSKSSLLPIIYARLQALFLAVGFPPSELFTILTLKLSQTISSSILTLPFSLTFLLFTKASILSTLDTNEKTRPFLSIPSLSSIMSLYIPLLHTSLCNTLLIISANATAFSILFLAFNLLQGLGFSSPNSLLLVSSAGAILYSIIFAHAIIITNLALALSGVEGRGGYMPILKACVLIRGRTSKALSLAVPIGLAMAGIEALFQFRIVNHHQNPSIFVAVEPLFIAYLYSIFVVLDTIVTYMFLNICKRGSSMDHQECYILHYADEEIGGHHIIKDLKELP